MFCETAEPNLPYGNFTAEERNRQYYQAALKLLREYHARGYLGEFKYDGTRATISKRDGYVTVTNRHGVDYTRRMPELVSAAKQIEDDFTIDGEIVYVNPETGEIEFTPCQRRCSTKDPAKRWYLMNMENIKVDFFSWTILSCNGENLEDLGYLEQKKILKKVIPQNSRIHYTPHRFDLAKFFTRIRRQGEEGLILKKPDAPYEHGRSFSWLKLKNWRFKTCNVAGYTPGRNSRKPFFGSLVLTEGEEFIGCAGSGPSDWELRQITDILHDSPEADKKFGIGESYTPVNIDLKVLVRYYKITDAGVMRFPVFEKVMS